MSRTRVIGLINWCFISECKVLPEENMPFYHIQLYFNSYLWQAVVDYMYTAYFLI